LTCAALALGSNIPPRRATIRRALAEIDALADVTIVSVSRIYETEPEGGLPQERYLNAATLLETDLGPHDLLHLLETIESSLGRGDKGGRGPRTIDLDIILYGRRAVHDQEIEIPHPRFRERGFVLQPLADIIPGFVDPVSKHTIRSLLDDWIGSGGRPDQGRSFYDID